MPLDLDDLADEYDDLVEEAEEEGDTDTNRMKAIRELAEAVGYDDIREAARSGVDLIAEDEFEDFAQETAESMGIIPDTNAWPFTCINWHQAAEELQSDYSSVEFDDTTYWYRAD